jgi:hypothetical protein
LPSAKSIIRARYGSPQTEPLQFTSYSSLITARDGHRPPLQFTSYSFLITDH